MTLESTATGTGSLIVEGTATGNVTVERYIPQYSSKGTTGFHFLSSPVTAQNISTEFFNVGNPPAGDDFYYWNEVHNYWINIKEEGGTYNQGDTWAHFSNLANPLFIVGKGYFVAYQATSDPPREFSGSLNSGDLASGTGIPTLTYTADKGNGWNLIGNPYPSAIDWDEGDWNLSNVDGSVYVYKGSTGQYVSWNGTSGDLTDGIIPAMHGFYVKANAASPSLTIPVASKVHLPSTYYKSNETIPELLVLHVKGNNYEDNTYINFNADATDSFDSKYDAYKLYGTEEAPQLYSIASDNTILSINVLHQYNEQTRIPLGLKVGIQKEYVISVKENTLTEGNEIYLEDLKTEIITNLITTPEYSFVANPEDLSERFILHFIDITGIHNHYQNQNTIRTYASNNTLYILNPKMKQGTVTIYNLTGQKVTTFKLTGDTKQQQTVNTVNMINIVKIRTDDEVVSGKVIFR